MIGNSVWNQTEEIFQSYVCTVISTQWGFKLSLLTLSNKWPTPGNSLEISNAWTEHLTSVKTLPQKICLFWVGITTRNFPFWAGSISRDFPRVGNYTVEWAVTYLIRSYVCLKGCCFFSLSLHLFSHGPREKGEVHKPLDSHTSAYVSSPPLNHLRSRHLPGLESQSPECLGSPGCKENFFAPSKALGGRLCGNMGPT